MSDLSTLSSPRIRARSTARLVRSLMLAELRVFFRQPVMIALTLLLPIGLIAITALSEVSDNPQVWATIAGRNMVAALCITVYFVSLNTITARRHTLALKRLRTTALPGPGIVIGLLTPPMLVGIFQVIVILGSLVVLGSEPPQHLVLLAVSALVGMVVALLAGVATSGFTTTPEKAQWTMLPLFVATMGATAVLPAVADAGLSLGLRAVPLVANAHLASTGWHAPSPGRLDVAFDLVLMLLWIAVLLVLSWRTFRWEGRR